VNRRDFLRDAALTPILANWLNRRSASDSFATNLSRGGQTPVEKDLGLRLVDVTTAAGIQFQHNTGAYGGKLLPETLGAGCAFLDYDADGWQDILLINGMDWPGHKRQRSALKLYRKTLEGTIRSVLEALRAEIRASVAGKLGGMLIRPATRGLRARLDPDTYGGGYLLGLNGLVVVAHGSSSSTAIANAVRMAARGVEHRLVERLGERLPETRTAPRA